MEFDIPIENKIREYIISINSLDATTSINGSTYRTSCDFDIPLLRPYDNVMEMELIGGYIPPTTEPYLFIDYIDKTLGIENNIHTPRGDDYDGILRYQLPATNSQNLLDHKSILTTIMGSNRRIDKLNIKLYDKNGDIASFGTDLLQVNSSIGFSNANPSVITYVGNANFAPGDIIYIRNFTNGSTLAINKMINETIWTVNAIVSPTSIQIEDPNGNILDLSGEAANQQDTVDETPYALGSGAIVQNIAGLQLNDVTLISAFGGMTEVTTSGTHGYIAGQDIRIYDVKNCALQSDNNKMNKPHIINTITAPNRFTINETLSSYVTPRNTTNLSQPTHPLGSRAYILHDKYQCSFDIRFRTIYQDIKYTE